MTTLFDSTSFFDYISALFIPLVNLELFLSAVLNVSIALFKSNQMLLFNFLTCAIK